MMHAMLTFSPPFRMRWRVKPCCLADRNGLTEIKPEREKRIFKSNPERSQCMLECILK